MFTICWHSSIRSLIRYSFYEMVRELFHASFITIRNKLYSLRLIWLVERTASLVRPMEDIHKVKLCERFKVATSFGMISPEVRVGVNFRFQREREKIAWENREPFRNGSFYFTASSGTAGGVRSEVWLEECEVEWED